MFPELEDSSEDETAVPWDYNNEFVCSSLAVYFEVHCIENKTGAIHPDSVELIQDQGSAMRFYEASRALKGDEGPEMQNIARIGERQHLHKQRKKWKKQYGSLRVKPDPCPVVRVHPAVTLLDVLTDSRMVVPNVSCDCCLRFIFCCIVSSLSIDSDSSDELDPISYSISLRLLYFRRSIQRMRRFSRNIRVSVFYSQKERSNFSNTMCFSFNDTLFFCVSS